MYAPPLSIIVALMSANVPAFSSCRYPVVRLAIAASPLQLHLSPYRYQQLMTVLQSAMAAQEGPATAQAASSAAAAAGDKPLWMSEAEYTAKVGCSELALHLVLSGFVAAAEGAVCAQQDDYIRQIQVPSVGPVWAG